MNIIDTYNDIVTYFQNKTFDLLTWRCYASNISPVLSEKVENDANAYDLNEQVIPVINTALQSIEKLEETHNSFISVTNRLDEKFTELFGFELDADIILYLGLCNGAGWATNLNGRKVVLLGIEKIIELNWCDEDSMLTLIYHELGHIWHSIAGNLYYTTDKKNEKSLWQLYQEGVAMYCEQLLCNNFNHYHQDKNGWLDWCLENEVSIKTEYLRRMNNFESTQDFFGDWCSYMGYTDVGYFLGCEFIKTLAIKYSLKEIANLDIKVIASEFENFTK